MKPSYEELEARCAALAAENAGMKAAAKKVIKMNRQHAKDQHGDPMIAESWACVKVLRKAKSETPVTDAFLAEVRAQGVDALVERRLTAARLAKEAGHEITARDLEDEAIRARFFAMELRKGVQS
ncbi:hypothetical protein ACENXD_001902 [Enterobacter bugandensis]